MTVTESLDLSEEIERAISDKSPVVVLESTVIAHGLPQPQNFQTALSLEQIIREVGAIPATVGMLYGRLRVGLTKDEIEILANANDIKKLSTRDLAIALARQWNGATTVAATIWIAIDPSLSASASWFPASSTSAPARRARKPVAGLASSRLEARPNGVLPPFAIVPLIHRDRAVGIARAEFVAQ